MDCFISGIVIAGVDREASTIAAAAAIDCTSSSITLVDITGLLREGEGLKNADSRKVDSLATRLSYSDIWLVGSTNRAITPGG